MRLAEAELLESRQILPGQWLQTYAAPWLTGAGTRASQFVHVRTADYSGLVLRRPFSINTLDRAAGTLTIHFRITGKGTEWLARARPGERLEVLGPLGRPFEVDPRSRHVLLVAGGLGIAGVRALADEAL
ncbi:MAG: siderophore-interacting protein, partial [Candidatus Limnocylindrales bacterium]